MARDPQIQHAEHELRHGLARARRGDDLADRPALREELLYLGLLFVDYEDQLHVSPEGRKLLA
ncbi:MAG: hypothetical protein ABWZ76_11335 [Acidimicrobiales bacterium]